MPEFPSKVTKQTAVTIGNTGFLQIQIKAVRYRPS